MRCWRLALVVWLGLAMSGCGASGVIQQHNAEDAQAAADIAAGTARVREQCEAELKSPELTQFVKKYWSVSP